MTRRKIVAIIGLPGSGKTHLARRLRDEIAGSLVYDDPEWEDQPNLLGWIEAHPECVEFIVPTTFLCVESQRVSFLKAFAGFDVELRFFANDLPRCLLNIERRADGRKVDRYVRYISERYRPPYVDYDVYSPDAD